MLEAVAVSPTLVNRLGVFYSYFLVIAAGLAAAMRLFRRTELAAVVHLRLQKAGARLRYRQAALILAFGSFPTLPLYIYRWHGQRWLLITFAYGMASALEFFTNSHANDNSGLERQNLLYGIAYVLLFAVSGVVLFHWK